MPPMARPNHRCEHLQSAPNGRPSRRGQGPGSMGEATAGCSFLTRAQGTTTLYGRALAAAVSALVTMAVAVIISVAYPASADPVLLSQGKPATASSTENAGSPASAAVDGNNGTRWSSAFSDPQWLQVDLGETAAISQV